MSFYDEVQMQVTKHIQNAPLLHGHGHVKAIGRSRPTRQSNAASDRQCLTPSPDNRNPASYPLPHLEVNMVEVRGPIYKESYARLMTAQHLRRTYAELVNCERLTKNHKLNLRKIYAKLTQNLWKTYEMHKILCKSGPRAVWRSQIGSNESWNLSLQ